MTMPHPDLIWILCGLAGLLSVASAVGYALARSTAGTSNAVVENLNDRIRAWWVMVILMSIALIGGRIGVMLLFLLTQLPP